MYRPSKIVYGVAAVVCCVTIVMLAGTGTTPISEDISLATSTVQQNTQSNIALNASTIYNADNTSTSVSNSNANWGDLRPLAMELTSYVGAKGHGYTSFSGGYFSKHPGCNGYDCSTASKITITFNNQTRTADALKVYTGLRSDCSGGVSAMLFFLGLTGSGENITNMRAANYCYAGTLVNAQTFGDLQVGDVLAISSHVGMVAYIDDSDVYMFDWGSDSAIDNCRNQGYHKKYSKTALVSTWRASTVHIRRFT